MCHIRFDYAKLSGLMGGRNSTVYLTIMRDPVDIFVSEWFYYRLDGRYSMSLGQHSTKCSFRGVRRCHFSYLLLDLELFEPNRVARD